jgi:hypothetical protein
LQERARRISGFTLAAPAPGMIGSVKLLLTSALVAAAAAAPSMLAAAPPAPALSVAGTQPVAVRGAHFLPHEWVRVTVLAKGSHTARPHASGTGTFTVTFPGLLLGACAGLQVRAVGSRGSVATLKLPRRACMPAKSP